MFGRRLPIVRRGGWESIARACDQRSARIVVRVGAVMFLALVAAQGLSDGGHLDYPGSPWEKLPGRVASLFGFAADSIKISGLKNHDAEAVLAPLGVNPGGSLIGFDATNARKLLENMDWILSAKVSRMFPNQLEITVVEREPFAIWQREGIYYVIDRTGAAMSSLDPARMTKLPLVTGEGAQGAISELVNQLEAHQTLKSRVLAAARVGQRRWTLHLDNGVTIALPEQGVERALAQVDSLERRYGLLSKGIKDLDMRIADRITVSVAAVPAETSRDKLKVSQRQ